MFMAVLTLAVALSISVVAAAYSIIGLMAIFAAAPIAIATMGTVLEVGKLVTASWLYNNWNRAPLFLKSYLTIAVVVLMIITSMGIFGFLSKAHIDQNAPSNNVSAQIDSLNLQISREEKIISRNNKILDQLDKSIDSYIELDYISRGLDKREEQSEERQRLQSEINGASGRIAELEVSRFEYEQQVRDLELEVGPIRFIAELVYGDSSTEILESAVRGVILLLVFVFDPLAVLLLIAANSSLAQVRETKTEVKKRKQELSNTTKIIETPIGLDTEDGEVVVQEPEVEPEKPKSEEDWIPDSGIQDETYIDTSDGKVLFGTDNYHKDPKTGIVKIKK
jgi:hypothetical protein|tara:strand:+ start:8901 stop:9911 length:1011 start_codon:yes stop_codon:yes gene_type:complete